MTRGELLEFLTKEAVKFREHPNFISINKHLTAIDENNMPSKVEFVKNHKSRIKVTVYFPDGTSKEFKSATKANKEIKIGRNRLNKDGYDAKSGLRWDVCECLSKYDY